MSFQAADKNSSKALEQDANVASDDALQVFKEGDKEKVGYSPFCELALKLGSMT